MKKALKIIGIMVLGWLGFTIINAILGIVFLAAAL